MKRELRHRHRQAERCGKERRVASGYNPGDTAVFPGGTLHQFPHQPHSAAVDAEPDRLPGVAPRVLRQFGGERNFRQLSGAGEQRPAHQLPARSNRSAPEDPLLVDDFNRNRRAAVDHQRRQRIELRQRHRIGDPVGPQSGAVHITEIHAPGGVLRRQPEDLFAVQHPAHLRHHGRRRHRQIIRQLVRPKFRSRNPGQKLQRFPVPEPRLRVGVADVEQKKHQRNFLSSGRVSASLSSSLIRCASEARQTSVTSSVFTITRSSTPIAAIR